MSGTDPLAPFSEPTRAWFREAFAEPTRAAGPGLAGHRRRRAHAAARARPGSGKTLAAFLWCLDRLFTDAEPRASRAALRVLYVSPLKALDLRRGAQPARAAGRHPPRGRARGHRRCPRCASPSRTGDTPADARRQLVARPAGHPGHHARVALPAADQPGARGAARRRARDRRRGARHGRHQARRAPGALARAPGRADRCGRRSGSACRRRSARWRRSPPSWAATGRAARSGSWTPGARQDARARGDRAGRGHGRHRRARSSAAGDDRPRDRGRALDLAVDPPAAAGADPGASVHAGLRQLAAPGRAAGRAPERAGRRGAGAGRTTAASRASSGWRSRRRSRPGACRRWWPPPAWSWASTWAPSTWSCRSRRRRRWRPACSASGGPGTRSASRRVGKIFPKYRGDLLEAAVVVRRMLDGAIEETRIPRNPLDVLAQQIVAICADGRLDGRRAARARDPRRAVPRPLAAAARGRARHALRPLPVRRVRRAASRGWCGIG